MTLVEVAVAVLGSGVLSSLVTSRSVRKRTDAEALRTETEARSADVTAWALTQETWSREFDRMRRQIEHLESDLRDLRNARNRERVDLEQQLSDERSRRQLLAQRVDSLESQIRAAGLVPVAE